MSRLAPAGLVLLLVALALPPLARAQPAPPQPPADLERVAAAYAQAIAWGEIEEALGYWDVSRFVYRALPTERFDTPAANAMRLGFLSIESANPVQRMVSSLAAAAKAGGDYTLLRIQRADDGWRPLYRSLDDNGVNYHELYAVYDTTAGWRFEDTFVYLTGGTVSETIRQLFEATGLLDGDAIDETSPRARAMSELFELQQAGDHAGLLRTLASLPKRIRENRALLFMRWQAAEAVGGDEADRAAELLEAHLGDDPAAALSLVDHYFVSQQYDRALAAIDRLDAAVDDPYLDLMRANVLRHQDADAGIAMAEQALTRLPGLLQAHWTYITILLETERWDAVADALDAVTAQFGLTFDPDALAELEPYHGFGASEAFDAWAARLRVAQSTSAAADSLAARPPHDPRIAAQLDSLGVVYEIDQDGDFDVVFDIGEGRSQQAYILSSTEEYEGREVREILSVGYRSEDTSGALPPSVANLLLERSANMILGGWTKQGPLAIYTVQLDADAPAAWLYEMLVVALTAADDLEAELTGDTDEF